MKNTFTFLLWIPSVAGMTIIRYRWCLHQEQSATIQKIRARNITLGLTTDSNQRLLAEAGAGQEEPEGDS